MSPEDSKGFFGEKETWKQEGVPEEFVGGTGGFRPYIIGYVEGLGIWPRCSVIKNVLLKVPGIFGQG